MRVAFVSYYYYSLKCNPNTFNFRREKKKNDNFSKLCNRAPVLQGHGNKPQKKSVEGSSAKNDAVFLHVFVPLHRAIVSVHFHVWR